MAISGKTRVCGVIGDPIEHSLSPAIQNAAFSHLKLGFVFLAFAVSPAELEDAVRGMRGLGIHGLNVTMPHKKAVTAFLDELDPTAKFLCAVNTILNRDGRLCGFNTDGVGASKALQGNGIMLSGKKVLLLGAGGAAKAIAFQLATEADKLVILNRTAKKAEELAESLSDVSGKEVKGAALSLGAVQENLRDSDVLINATSVGMHPNASQSPVPPEQLKPDLTVMDIVYNPVETKLARDAKTAGARVVSGVEMLVHQGAASFEIWTGRLAPVEVMRKAVLRQLKEAQRR
jgi:shikimate dehydrogenase